MEAHQAILQLVLFIFFLVSVQAQNIDVKQPVIRGYPLDGDTGLFGYSVALHQVVASPSDFQSAVEATRVIVAAPKGTPEGGEVDEVGLVFECTLTSPGECRPFPHPRLYDKEANIDSQEVKSGQFLGSTLLSNGDSFIVCANRYLQNLNGFIDGPGRCFVGERDLDNGEVLEIGGRTLCGTSTTFCNSGASAAYAKTGDGDNYALGIGSPGGFRWRGILSRYLNGDLERIGNGEGTQNYLLQGYAMASGYLLSNDVEDFVVSVPRGENYKGYVNFVENAAGIRVISQPIQGTQIGEYFGYSLLTADLNGDGYDELIVGAPLYSRSQNPEAGRVYVYKNTAGSFQADNRVILTGNSESYGRFGYAMANMGDITGDGLEDIAISAPFGDGSGTVFIYRGTASSFILNTPAQIITSSVLSTTLDLTAVKGFGTALSSIDVDGNSYNDLAIGAYQSQQVFVLRTLPAARVAISITAEPRIVDLDSKICNFNGTAYACFTVTVCATLQDDNGVGNSLTLDYVISGDTENEQLQLEQRVFFDDVSRSDITISEDLSPGVPNCIDRTVHILDAITDRLNGFVTQFEVKGQVFNPDPEDGDGMLMDLGNFPTLFVTGSNLVQVETLKMCSGGTCYPDLRIEHTRTVFTSDTGTGVDDFVAGLVSNIAINLNVKNFGEDAFRAAMTFVLPSVYLRYIRVDPRESLITCDSVVLDNEYTQYECVIGIQFGRDETGVNIAVLLSPRAALLGNEIIPLSFNLSSLNPENATDVGDNSVSISLESTAEADLSIDLGIVTPDQVSYSNEVPTNLTTFVDIGPKVTTTFLVRNAGPSTIPTVAMEIVWPLNSTEEGNFYLIPTMYSTDTTVTVTCTPMSYFNPLGLDPPPEEEEGEGEGEEGGQNIGKRRRRSSSGKRWVALGRTRSVRRRSRRQNSSGAGGQNQPELITINCNAGAPGCVSIQCRILNLPKNTEVDINIQSYLDERFFATKMNSYTITSSAQVSIVDGDYIQELNRLNENSTAVVMVIPGFNTREPESTPSYVIVLAVILSILLIAVLVGAILLVTYYLYKKRKATKEKHDQQLMQENPGSQPANGN